MRRRSRLLAALVPAFWAVPIAAQEPGYAADSAAIAASSRAFSTAYAVTGPP